MNQMNAFLKEKYDMKTFDHVALSTKLPEITTQTIKVSFNYNSFIRQK